MGSHSVTCHPTQVNVPRVTPAMQVGTRFTYPGGMEGWVDLVELIVPQPGVEQRPFDHESDAEPLHHQENWYNITVWLLLLLLLLLKKTNFTCIESTERVGTETPTNCGRIELSYVLENHIDWLSELNQIYSNWKAIFTSTDVTDRQTDRQSEPLTIGRLDI